MGQSMLSHHQRLSFEDVQHILSTTPNESSATPTTTTTKPWIIINTLPLHRQQTLLAGTLAAEREEQMFHDIESTRRQQGFRILVYGENSLDYSVETKARQLLQLGFSEVYIYPGGIFEWILLQDIYGPGFFPTRGAPVQDLLSFKPASILQKQSNLLRL